MLAEAVQAEHIFAMGSERVQEQARESFKHAEALTNELEVWQLLTPPTACQEHVPNRDSEIPELSCP